MKKIYIVMIFAALALFAGCSGAIDGAEGVDITQTEGSKLSIGLPNKQSRTSVDENGAAKWSDGDNIALWAEGKTGVMKFNGVKFTMYHYWHSWQYAVFTSTESLPTLSDAEYTYYAVYPMPESTTNQIAHYTLPVEQKSDSFNGSYDIMVATPITAPAIIEGEVNCLDLDFAHKTHTLKVTIAENNLDEDIAALQFTFPTNVTGTMSVNAKDETEAATLTNGSKSVHLNLTTPIKVGGTAWGAIFPTTVSGDVEVVAIGANGTKSKSKKISISKEYREGHITPLSFSVPQCRPTLRFSIGGNNLGEDVKKLTITDNYNNSISFDVNKDNRYDYVVDGETDDTVFDHYEGQTFTATFESEHAIVSTTFVMPTTLTSKVNVIPALTVPYLLFEDFSCIHTAGESYGDNTLGGNVTGGATDERKQPGVSLDGYMWHQGWNAARFLLGVGTCPRINVRAQQVKIYISFASQHHGRLDTPPLTGLKSGAKVKLKLEFNAGGVEYEGAGGDVIGLNVATHTNLGNPIDGIPTGTSGIGSEYSTTLADYGTVIYATSMASNYTLESFGSTFPLHTAIFNGATNATRLVFYPTTSVTLSGVDNCESAVYIDNIKVSIVPEED